jgi:AraC family transcriptional regulator of adaptative response/methylated-DNA-[protein]-cysteine methyltransferase
MQRLPGEKVMYRALVERDASYEGVFFACVKTTGIFCRPTCKARKPKAENVEYVATAQQALHAGYRPCKVCRPLEVAADEPEWMRELVDRIKRADGARIRDGDLRAIGVEPARARRRFKQTYGMTFHAFQRAWRMGAAMRTLERGGKTMNAAIDSGYESESGFREAFSRLFGEAPSSAKRAGTLSLVATWYSTPLGRMIAIASDEGVMLLEFLERRALEAEIHWIRNHFKGVITPGRNRHLDALELELEAYFKGGAHEFTVPLVAPGSDFQRRVWDALLTIPAGKTWTYQQLASEVGSAGASRAAGRACGENRIALLIPCHRVVRTDGTLGGYGGQLWRKERLLEHERSEIGAAKQFLLAHTA